jgi:hypothetical protein
MWLGAGQAGSKLTLLSRSNTTSGTTDSEYLFWAGSRFAGAFLGVSLLIPMTTPRDAFVLCSGVGRVLAVCQV